tara:strand:+ start:108 stop:401 length:294 start_codon:yes stop_codon:yes gene_type:complete
MDSVYYNESSNIYTKLTQPRNKINFMNEIMYQNIKQKNHTDKFIHLTKLIQEYRQNIKTSIQNKDKKWWIKEQINRLNTLIDIFNSICQFKITNKHI